MILIYEPVCFGTEHAMFNTGIIQSALLLANDGCVAFLAEATHLAAVQDCIPSTLTNQVNWIPIPLMQRQVRGLIQRTPHEWRLFSYVWEITKTASIEGIIATSVTEAGLLAIKFRLAIVKSPIPVAVIFHSILPQFFSSAKRRSLLQRFNSDNLRFIVLGQYIHKLTLEILPTIKQHLRYIAHPYPFEDAPQLNGRISNQNGSPCFGFLGVGNREKGFPTFLKLIESTINDIHRPKFKLIGKVNHDCTEVFENFNKKMLQHFSIGSEQNVRLSTEEYREQLNMLDYVVLPYEKEHYKLTCSGAALDSLFAIKPIVGLNTSHLSELFDIVGDIGYLCDSPEELLETIRTLTANPQPEKYAAQCRNLFNGRRHFEPETVSKELGAALT